MTSTITYPPQKRPHVQCPRCGHLRAIVRPNVRHLRCSQCGTSWRLDDEELSQVSAYYADRTKRAKPPKKGTTPPKAEQKKPQQPSQDAPKPKGPWGKIGPGGGH